MIGEECPVCYEEMDTSNSIITTCKHKFCMSCTLGTIWESMKKDILSNPSCPLCRTEMHIMSNHHFSQSQILYI